MMNTTLIRRENSSGSHFRGLFSGALTLLIGTSACLGASDVDEISPTEPQTLAVRNNGRSPAQRACDDKLGSCYIDCSVRYPDNPGTLNELMRDACEASCDATHRSCTSLGVASIGATNGVLTKDRYVANLSEDPLLQFEPEDDRADLSRIAIRTAAGETAIKGVLNKTFTSDALEGGFVLGTPAAVAGSLGTLASFAQVTGKLGFTCVDKYCDCTGAADCGAMVLSGKCGTWVACTRTQCICEIKR